MKSKCIVSFLVAALFWPISAQAEPVLSWEDCLKEARVHNPELVAAEAGLNEAKADKALARSAVLPQVSASADTDRKSVAGTRSTAHGYGVSAQQLLFDGFKSSHDMAAARQKVEAASYDHQVVSSNVRLDLWSAFIGLLSAQESLAVTQDIVQRRQQNLELVTLRYNVGREHKGSLLTARANLSQANYEWQEAQRQLELYQRRLSRQMGRETFVPMTVSGDLMVGPVDEEKPDFERLVNTTPLLKELTAKKEAARFDLKSARSSLFPQVYATAGTTKSGADWPPQTEGWSAGFSVSIPLFEGGKKQAQIDRSRAALEASKADERSGRDGVILTLAETWTAWQNAVSQALVKEEFLEASRERVMIVEGQYSAGMVTFNDWTIIEDDLVNNQKAWLKARADALTAQGAWMQAKGVTLDE